MYYFNVFIWCTENQLDDHFPSRISPIAFSILTIRKCTYSLLKFRERKVGIYEKIFVPPTLKFIRLPESVKDLLRISFEKLQWVKVK